VVKPVDVQSIRVVFDDYFRIVEARLTYQRADGTTSEPQRRLSFERGDSAAAVVFDSARSCAVLTRQLRFPTLEKGPGWLLEIVAGSVDDDESPEVCIRREILEEVGYEVIALGRIATFYTSPGGSSERIHLFHAEVDSGAPVGAGGGLASEQEEIDLVVVPFADVPTLLASGEVVDAKTIIGLTWLVRDAPG
jgi:ADP-ribose pyrophosphatase